MVRVPSFTDALRGYALAVHRGDGWWWSRGGTRNWSGRWDPRLRSRGAVLKGEFRFTVAKHLGQDRSRKTIAKTVNTARIEIE